MAYTNDYTTLNACDATTGWTPVGGGSVALNTAKNIQGTGCIGLRSSTTAGVHSFYYDLATGDRFRLDQEDILMWFYYVKGKGAAYLGALSDDFKIRCYINGTVNYVEYYQGGDPDLPFGWKTYGGSGSNYQNSSGSPSLSDLVHRIEIVLDFANPNDDTSQDAPLFMDYWRSGTKIVVSEGTPASPIDFSGIKSYSDTNALGVVQTDGPLVLLQCGLDIGNGSDGTNNEGNLTDEGKFILFNQFSSEVKYNLTIKNYSTLILGTLEVGTDDNYAVDGCQLVVPASRYPDISVENGGTFKLYDSKLYRWRYIYLGAASDTGSTVELDLVDIDSCETVYFRANTLNISNVEIHDNAAQVNNHCGEMIVTPDISANIQVHDCNEGIHFRETLSMDEYIAGDNTNYDLAVLEAKTVTLVNSVFSASKLKRVAT